MRADSLIGHIDADAFYVNAERVRDQFLLGKQVAVLGNQGACVIAKSYEMKACGVKTGEPVWEAKKKCPEGIYIKTDFRWYEVLSRQLHETLRTISPTVEWYSIDEFFFEVLDDPKYTLQQTAIAVRDRVSQAVGVPVTVGIGRSKALAKLFSDTAKPFGAHAPGTVPRKNCCWRNCPSRKSPASLRAGEPGWPSTALAPAWISRVPIVG
jgi:nucleotidyltransferase/DNA polymerase involved in DNA repair